MAPTLSVVVPVYQNEASLPDTVPRLLAVRELLPNGFDLETLKADLQLILDS